jgi:hypothetical protein
MLVLVGGESGGIVGRVVELRLIGRAELPALLDLGLAALEVLPQRRAQALLLAGLLGRLGGFGHRTSLRPGRRARKSRCGRRADQPRACAPLPLVARIAAFAANLALWSRARFGALP